MKKSLHVLIILLWGTFFVKAQMGQVTINNVSHSLSGVIHGTNLLNNGSFESILGSPAIEFSSSQASPSWYSVWSSGCSIPGWTSNLSPASYGAVGPIINGKFGNMANSRDCSTTQFFDNSPPASGISSVNVLVPEDGNNVLYMGLGEGWVSAAPDPNFIFLTGEVFPSNLSSSSISIGATPNSITQTVVVTAGTSYGLEFWVTGEGNDADGFFELIIGNKHLWLTIPADSTFSKLGSDSRYYTITFTADTSSSLDISFVSYGHQRLNELNSPAWANWFNTGTVGAELFLDKIKLVDLSLLPIKLTYLHLSHKKNNTALLTWGTEMELNNMEFDIEYALYSNHKLEFETIGSVKGAGTTLETQQYQYEVPNLIPGVYYFRLKQINSDGTHSYTAIKTLEIKGTGTKYKIFPTLLTENQSNIYVRLPLNKVFQIKIVSSLGQVIEEKQAILNTAQYFTFQIDRSKYTSGIYFIRLSHPTHGLIQQSIRVE